MTKRVIIFEHRSPRTRAEKRCYGQTIETGDGIVDVWLSTRQSQRQTIDTYWHEMAHVFFRIFTRNRRMTVAQEEQMARVIGKATSELLTKGKSNGR